MRELGSVCVFCGSSSEVDPVFRDAARRLGARLAASGLQTVYGGGHIGLMGILADAARAGGGEVIGVIPEALVKRGLAHAGLTELHVVPSMHERKRLMFEKSDAFVVLPGGIGTLEEAFEVISWRQLALHDKPIVLVDVAGYWRPLLALIEATIAHGFAAAESRRLYAVCDSVERVIEAIEAQPKPRLAPEPARF